MIDEGWTPHVVECEVFPLHVRSLIIFPWTIVRRVQSWKAVMSVLYTWYMSEDAFGFWCACADFVAICPRRTKLGFHVL